jgi:hypothetical protein
MPAPARPTALRKSTSLLVACAALLGLGLTACGPRIEYRVRPDFAGAADIPDEVVLDDGTVVRYISVAEFAARKRARAQGRTFERPAAPTGEAAPAAEPWMEAEDGSVTMLAEEPVHVIFITMRAFREERYGDLWDQMVAESVRERAESEYGPEVARQRFIEWCAKSRKDALMLLNRMSHGFTTNGVVMRRLDGGMTRLSLPPQVSGDFKLKYVEIAFAPTPEGGNTLKLAGIR